MKKTMASLLLSLSFLIASPLASAQDEGTGHGQKETTQAPAPKAKSRRKAHTAPAVPKRQNVDEEDVDNSISERKYRHGGEELEVDPD